MGVEEGDKGAVEIDKVSSQAEDGDKEDLDLFDHSVYGMFNS